MTEITKNSLSSINHSSLFMTIIR